MAVYRITRFAASDMDKVREFIENMRDEIEGVGAILEQANEQLEREPLP